MTSNELLVKLADQAPWIIVLLIVFWLSLPQLAERFTIIAKVFRPFLKRWQERAEALENQRRKDALETAREDVRLVLKELTPPDAAKMEARLSGLEDAEAMLRAYVIYDELWHFHDNLDDVRRGNKPARRLSFETFEGKWMKGWRPFDDNGRFIDDGTGETHGSKQ